MPRLRKLMGYDSAHEHCPGCGKCIFGGDKAVKDSLGWYRHKKCKEKR